VHNKNIPFGKARIYDAARDGVKSSKASIDKGLAARQLFYEILE
jgi:hypothetical protein